MDQNNDHNQDYSINRVSSFYGYIPKDFFPSIVKKDIDINFADANFDFHHYFDIDQRDDPITNLPVKHVNEKTDKTIQHAMDVF